MSCSHGSGDTISLLGCSLAIPERLRSSTWVKFEAPILAASLSPQGYLTPRSSTQRSSGRMSCLILPDHQQLGSATATLIGNRFGPPGRA